MSLRGLEAISLPYQYLAERKKEFGKDYSGKLVKMFVNLFKPDEELSKKVVGCIEMLMNSILMIDDIEDNSTMRRGRPCAHLVYGTPATINSGNYHYFKFIEQMIEICPKEKLPEAMQEIIKLFKRGHEGQALEIFYRENQIVPTEEEYHHMVDLKSTSNIYFFCEIMKILSIFDFDFEPLCYLLGQYLQIGKDTKDVVIQGILRLHTNDEELEKLVVARLNESGSLEYTRQVLNELRNQIVSELVRLNADAGFIKLFEKADEPQGYNQTENLRKFVLIKTVLNKIKRLVEHLKVKPDRAIKL